MSPTLSAPPRIGLSSIQDPLVLVETSPDPTLWGSGHPRPRVPDLETFAQRFAQAVVDVVAGDRGPQQLLRHTSEGVYADLARRSASLQRIAPPDRRARRLRATVRSVRVFSPCAEAAELSIHVRHGQRSRAIAARLELFRGQWRCVALQFG